LASPTTGCARLQFASKLALYSLARSFRTAQKSSASFGVKKTSYAQSSLVLSVGTESTDK
jgi:hypothetical protein